MILTKNCCTFLMFSVIYVTLITAVDPNKDLRDCKYDMLNYFGRFNLLDSVKYSIKHHLMEDFNSGHTYARKYYEDFKKLKLVFSDGIRLPSVFCEEQVQDNQDELENCKNNLSDIFGTEKNDILDQALYNNKQSRYAHNVNPGNNIHPHDSYANNYLEDIANHITVDNNNLMYQSPATYCDNVCNHPFQSHDAI